MNRLYLFLRSTTHDLRSTVPVLSPELLKKVERIYLKSRYMATDVFAGEYETAFRGLGMEFEEVREYTPGDDVRSIDWNVSARMDKPFVKVYREEREQTVMLVVDGSGSQRFGSVGRLKKDVVAEIAAILAYAAIKSNDKVGLIIFTDHVERYIPPKKGRSHVWHVISEILSYKPMGNETNFKEALEYFSQVIHRRSICFVISDFIASDYEKSFAIARFKHDVVALMIQDPLELSIPSGGLMRLKDLESGQERSVDLSQARTRMAFANEQKMGREQKIRDLRSKNIDVLNLKTNEDTIEPLLQFFRMREKRR